MNDNLVQIRLQENVDLNKDFENLNNESIDTLTSKLIALYLNNIENDMTNAIKFTQDSLVRMLDNQFQYIIFGKSNYNK